MIREGEHVMRMCRLDFSMVKVLLSFHVFSSTWK